MKTKKDCNCTSKFPVHCSGDIFCRDRREHDYIDSDFLKGFLLYNFSPSGRILNPGTFQNQNRYILLYYNIYLDGVADIDDGKIIGCKIQKEDKILFPELCRKHWVKFTVTSEGFVEEV